MKWFVLLWIFSCVARIGCDPLNEITDDKEKSTKKELLLAKNVKNGVQPSDSPVVKVPAPKRNCTTPECVGGELLRPTEEPPTTEEQMMDHFVSIWLTHEGIPGIIFLWGNCVSMLGILASLVSFCLFPSLRTQRGKATMNLMTALLLAKLDFWINPYLSFHRGVCSIAAMFQHYFCLAAFLWMSVLAYDLWQSTISRRRRNRVEESDSPVRRTGDRPWTNTLPVYFMFAWGVPMSPVMASFVIEVMTDMKFKYGNQRQCGVLGHENLLYSLAIPLMVISLLNMIFFILTMKKMSSKKWDMSRCSCCKRNMDSDSRAKNTRNASGNRRQSDSDEDLPRNDPVSTCQLWVYVRMSVIMSLAWTSGFLAVFSQTYGLWLIFVVLNSFQGIFICVSFTLSAKTLAMYANKFAWLTPRRTRRYAAPPGDVLEDEPAIVLHVPTISDGSLRRSPVQMSTSSEENESFIAADERAVQT